MVDPKDIAEKIQTLAVGIDVADSAGLDDTMEQISMLMGEAVAAHGEMPPEVMAAFDDVLKAQSVAIQKQMGMSDEQIAETDQMMADYAEQAAAERRDTPDEVLAVFDAINDGNAKAVAKALDHADINVRMGEYDKTPLYAAMADFDLSPEIITLLLDRGADPAQGLSGDSSVLHGMAFGAYRDWAQQDVTGLVARCVAAGAALEQRTEHLGWTPLHTAVSEGESKVVHALLEAGADANALMGVTEPQTFNNGGTSLQMAQATPEMVELLLSFGADPLKANAYGQTSLDAVRENAQDEASFGQDCARSLALMEARVAGN